MAAPTRQHPPTSPRQHPQPAPPGNTPSSEQPPTTLVESFATTRGNCEGDYCARHLGVVTLGNVTTLSAQATQAQAPGVRPRIVAGTVAAVLLAISSWGSAAVPQVFHTGLIPGLTLTRPGDYGSPLMATISVLSLGVIAWSWWSLRNRGLTAMDWIKITALWAAPLLIAAPLQSRDLYSYAAQGQLWAEGLSPYSNAVVNLKSDWVLATSPVWLETPAPYGPFFMLLARGIAIASLGNLAVAVFLFRLLAVASLVAVAWSIPILAQRLGLSAERTSQAMWLGVANPLVISQVVGGGHNDAMMAALTMLALAAATSWSPLPVPAFDGALVIPARGRSLAAATALVTLAAMVKITAIIALPFVVVAWVVTTGRTAVPRIVGACATAGAWAAGIAVTASVVTGLGFAWIIPVEGLEQGVSPSFTSAFGLIVALAGLSLGYGTAWQVPAVSAAHTLGLLALAAFLVFLFFLVVVRVLRSEERQLQVIVESLTVALVALVMLAPTIRFWYILWFLPLAALVVSGRRWTNILAVSSVLGSITVLPDGNSAVSEDMALPMVLLAVAVAAFLLTALPAWVERVTAVSPESENAGSVLVPAAL